MLYILGFKTPNADEVPEVLYLGNDGVLAQQIADTAPHPRVARMVNPTLFPVRHFTEEGAAAFAALHMEPAVVAKDLSVEAALALIDAYEVVKKEKGELAAVADALTIERDSLKRDLAAATMELGASLGELRALKAEAVEIPPPSEPNHDSRTTPTAPVETAVTPGAASSVPSVVAPAVEPTTAATPPGDGGSEDIPDDAPRLGPPPAKETKKGKAS